MSPPAGRRTMLVAAGLATVAAFAGAAVAQPAEIRGEIGYEGGVVIPVGEIEIHLEGAAAEDPAGRSVVVRIRSDGKSRTIAFVLPASVAPSSPATEIVAVLERTDGWMVARGSVRVEPDGVPVHVTLNTAMY